MHKVNQRPIDILLSPIQRFIHQEKSGGIILGFSVIIAIFLANSPWSAYYFHFLEQNLGFVFNGKPYLEFSIHHWINDGLMAVFFFVVGLELKREIIAGELSNPRKALLPIGAAIGGMLFPACIYWLLNPHGEAGQGWGIPMATDIVFALGVLYLVGNKVPLSLKVFLAALAIVDDLAAVLVIAFFYTSEISVINLIAGLCFTIIMYAGNKMGIRNVFFYAIVGIGGLWVAFLLSGIHATIAAVIAAFTIPADVRIDEKLYSHKIRDYLNRFNKIDPNNLPTLTNEQVHVLDNIKDTTNQAIPPLQRLEHALHPFVSFIIIPIFVLANAGISLSGINFDNLFGNNIFIGVSMGLLVGKVIGIVTFTYLFTRLKIAPASEGMNLKNLIGIGLLGSIGFTMSLFIASLAFTDEIYLIQAKAGIFTASIIGGTLGYFVLKRK